MGREVGGGREYWNERKRKVELALQVLPCLFVARETEKKLRGWNGLGENINRRCQCGTISKLFQRTLGPAATST